MKAPPFSLDEAEIIKTILSKHPNIFFAFGSRVKGTHKQFSDLDLCYKQAILDVDISNLLDAFEQSNLPFKVDVVSWDRCSSEFQRHIENDLILVEKLWR